MKFIKITHFIKRSDEPIHNNEKVIVVEEVDLETANFLLTFKKLVSIVSLVGAVFCQGAQHITNGRKELLSFSSINKLITIFERKTTTPDTSTP